MVEVQISTKRADRLWGALSFLPNSLGEKRPEPEGNQSPPSNDEVKADGAIPPLPPVSMASVFN
jgi:hypothetical protein